MSDESGQQGDDEGHAAKDDKEWSKNLPSEVESTNGYEEVDKAKGKEVMGEHRGQSGDDAGSSHSHNEDDDNDERTEYGWSHWEIDSEDGVDFDEWRGNEVMGEQKGQSEHDEPQASPKRDWEQDDMFYCDLGEDNMEPKWSSFEKALKAHTDIWSKCLHYGTETSNQAFSFIHRILQAMTLQEN